MKYQILVMDSCEELEDEVNDLFKSGWEPIGGVTAVCNECMDRHGHETSIWSYAQALVNKSKKGEEE